MSEMIMSFKAHVSSESYDLDLPKNEEAETNVGSPRYKITLGKWRARSLDKICPTESLGLALLLFEAVLEEHEDGSLTSIHFLVETHADHGIGVHRLSSEELQVLERPQQVLHNGADVLLEVFNLSIPFVLFEVLHYLFHVVLEVCGEVLLRTEASLDQLMVQNHVHTRH